MPSFDRLNKRALTLIYVYVLTEYGVKMRSLPYKRSLFQPSENLQNDLQDSEMLVPLQHKSWLICSNLTRLDITPMMSFLLPITEQRDGIP